MEKYKFYEVLHVVSEDSSVWYNTVLVTTSFQKAYDLYYKLRGLYDEYCSEEGEHLMVLYGVNFGSDGVALGDVVLPRTSPDYNDCVYTSSIPSYNGTHKCNFY